jgi:hypothetical protein
MTPAARKVGVALGMVLRRRIGRSFGLGSAIHGNCRPRASQLAHQKMRGLLALLCLCLSPNALGCRVVQWSAEEWAKNADRVYQGVVTSISMPVLDNKIVATDRLVLYRATADRLIRVKVYETLKGRKEEVLEVRLAWCGGGNAELGAMVVLYGLGEKWHARLLP